MNFSGEQEAPQIRARGTFMRKTLPAVGLSIAAITGCSTTGEQSTPPTTQAVWEYNDQDSLGIPSALTDCSTTVNDEPLGDFITPPDTTPDYSLSNIASFVEEHRKLSPQEMVDLYLFLSADRLNGNTFQLQFDEGVIPDSWKDAVENSTYDTLTDEIEYEIDTQQQVLIGKVDSLVQVMSEYPRNTTEMLGIDTVRIGNKYEDSTAGHFSPSENEIFIEFDRFGNSEDLTILRTVVTHEMLGHAAHAVYCSDNLYADKEISDFNGDFSYIGAPILEDYETHYAQVPQSLLEYGPSRVFAREYGAAAVEEDVATIVEFTLEKRGIIREGDLDFGSPLQQKQEIIVDRLEQLMPGFRQFVEERTNLLRRIATSEIYEPTQRDLEIPADIVARFGYADPSAEGAYGSSYDWDPSTEVLVFNGAVYDEKLNQDKSRGGTLTFFPRISIDTEGEVIYYEASCGCPVPEGTQERFLQSQTQATQGDLLIMTLAEWEALSDSQPRDPESRTFRVSVGSELHDDFYADNPQLVIARNTE